jgi:hypothetical protein
VSQSIPQELGHRATIRNLEVTNLPKAGNPTSSHRSTDQPLRHPSVDKASGTENSEAVDTDNGNVQQFREREAILEANPNLVEDGAPVEATIANRDLCRDTCCCTKEYRCISALLYATICFCVLAFALIWWLVCLPR